jgi:phosphatidylinositol-3-phosphatase
MNTRSKRTPSALIPLLFAAGVAAAQAAPAAPVARVKTVFVIALENTDWVRPDGDKALQIRGNSAAPFLNALTDGTLTETVDGRRITEATAFAAAYHNVLATPSGDNAHVHPSEPNYLWAEGGTDYGVHSDADPYGDGGTAQSATQHLSGLLERAGVTWRSYQEDIDLAGSGDAKRNVLRARSAWTVPLASFIGRSAHYTNAFNGSHQYGYAAKHNPMLFFADTNGGGDATPANPAARCYAPLEQLRADLLQDRVARYNWITPDLYNDMHTPLDDGFVYHGVRYRGAQARIAQGDAFLARIVPTIMASRAWRDGGAIVLWWDESVGRDADSYAATIPEIVISPLAHANVDGRPYASALNLSHSDDLRTMQVLFGVDPSAGQPWLGDAANARGLDDLFAPGALRPRQGPKK